VISDSDSDLLES